MEYVIKNGLSVCERGFVIIQEVEHYVKGGYVFCDPSLNHRAWGVTDKKAECEKCKVFKEEPKGQLLIWS